MTQVPNSKRGTGLYAILDAQFGSCGKGLLAGYLAEIRPLPAEARASQQPEILARWFEPGQWRRVEALTRLTLGEQ